jgi:hypothetical protein
MAARHSYILLALGLVPASAVATTLTHMNTRGLTRSSNQIVIGTVERVNSRWNERRTLWLSNEAAETGLAAELDSLTL